MTTILNNNTQTIPPKLSLLVADVDGTLVTKQKVLTERARNAVSQLHAADIIFTITSGRPPQGMRTLIDSLALTAPIAAFNGAVFLPFGESCSYSFSTDRQLLPFGESCSYSFSTDRQLLPFGESCSYSFSTDRQLLPFGESCLRLPERSTSGVTRVTYSYTKLALRYRLAAL
ncbi:HAD-IIB family hydrolase [Scytonema sp. NUACC21]